MKPDPYKLERSRRYLAKKRSEGKAPIQNKLRRDIKALPSNSDRFESSSDADEESRFDFESAEKVETLLFENDSFEGHKIDYSKSSGLFQRLFEFNSQTKVIHSEKAIHFENLPTELEPLLSAVYNRSNNSAETISSTSLSRKLNLSKIKHHPGATVISSVAEKIPEENASPTSELEKWLDDAL